MKPHYDHLIRSTSFTCTRNLAWKVTGVSKLRMRAFLQASLIQIVFSAPSGPFSYTLSQIPHTPLPVWTEWSGIQIKFGTRLSQDSHSQLRTGMDKQVTYSFASICGSMGNCHGDGMLPVEFWGGFGHEQVGQSCSNQDLPFKQGGVSLHILYHKYAMVYLGNLSESIIHLSLLPNCMESTCVCVHMCVCVVCVCVLCVCVCVCCVCVCVWRMWRIYCVYVRTSLTGEQLCRYSVNTYSNTQ